MKIELLYFEGCPGFEEALAVLEKTVEEEGLATRVEAIKLDSGDHPDFPGSPTILVDARTSSPLKNAGISPALRAAGSTRPPRA